MKRDKNFVLALTKFERMWQDLRITTAKEIVQAVYNYGILILKQYGCKNTEVIINSLHALETMLDIPRKVTKICSRF